MPVESATAPVLENVVAILVSQKTPVESVEEMALAVVQVQTGALIPEVLVVHRVTSAAAEFAVVVTREIVVVP